MLFSYHPPGGFGVIIIGWLSSSVPTGSTSTSVQLAAKIVRTKARRIGNLLSVFIVLVFKVEFVLSFIQDRVVFPLLLTRPRGRDRKGL